MIKRVLFGSLLFIVIFIGAALSFNFIQNRKHNTRPVEGYNPTMGKAYILYDGTKINSMQGYTTPIETGLYRDSIFPVSDDKVVDIVLADKVGNGADIKYELRSFDGSNLVEDGDFRFVSSDKGLTQYTAKLRMDLKVGTEYSFVIKVDKKEPIRYYTRVVRLETSRLSDFIAYAQNFSDAAFEGNAAETAIASSTDAVTTYNVSGTVAEIKNDESADIATSTDAMQGVNIADISSIFGSADAMSAQYDALTATEVTSDGNPGYVTLNSSYEDVIYSGMKIERISDPIPKIKEITTDSAVIELVYKAISEEENSANTFAISEYFTMEYNNGNASIDVHDYRRSVDQDFDASGFDAVTNSISLGITSDRSPKYIASEDSKTIAFVADNSLWVYNNKTGTYSNAYGTSTEEAEKERIPQEGYDMRLLLLEDNAVDFVVYGRINEGPREGQNGIALYEYNIETATLRELSFISTKMSFDAMKLSVGRFCYFDKKNRHFYTLIGDNLIDTDIFSGQKDTLVSGIPASQIMISDGMNVVAYPDKDDQTNVSTITLINFDTGKTTQKKEAGHVMAMMGFVGEDFLYGVSEPEYVSRDVDGTPVFLFDKLYITRSDGSVVKKYEREGVLISGIKFEDSTIYLDRVTANAETGEREKAEADYISYKTDKDSGGIRTVIAENEAGNDVVRLKLPDNIYVNSENEELFAKVAFNENEAEIVDEDSKIDEKSIYIYAPTGITGSSYSVGKAVQEVYEEGGFVVDAYGSTLYKEKQSRPYLTVAGTFDYKAVDRDEDTLAACCYMCTLAADLPSNYDEVRAMDNWMESFEMYGTDVKGINISGVKLDTAIGYLSDGYPFAARLSDRYVLVVSYNDDFIRYYDPIEDQEVRLQRYLFQIKCEDEGNEFYTFYK